MYRIVDLTVRPFPAPVGNGEALMRPPQSVAPIPASFTESITPGRGLADILGYYDFYHVMSGVQAGEIFTKGTLTTKPYTTCATYRNTGFPANGRPQYLADLGSEFFFGSYSLIDLAGAAKKATISAAELRKHTGGRPLARIAVLRTGYSASRPARPDVGYMTDGPSLSADAAQWLVEQGVTTVVTDTRTVDPRYALRAGDDVYGVFAAAGVLLIEDAAHLADLKAEHAHLFVGVPLPIRGVTGGSARVFAVNMAQPTDFVDCTHPLDPYPLVRFSYDVPFRPPETRRALDELGEYPNVLPGRIEPRELQGITQKTCRLTPFRIVNAKDEVVGEEMYIEYGHATGTHIEAAFYDPWGRHAVPEAILKRYVRIPKDRLVAEACLLDLSAAVGPLQQIDSAHLRDADPGLKRGDIAILRADIADWFFYGSVPGNTPGLSPDAAMYLVQKGVRGVICDFAIERTDPISGNIAVKYTPNKVHYYLHKNDVPISEWAVNLKLVRKPRFVAAIMAMPASHQGGFPAHILLAEDWS